MAPSWRHVATVSSLVNGITGFTRSEGGRKRMNMTPSRGGTCPCHAPGSRVGPRMTQRLLIGATFSLSSLPRLVQHDVVKLHPRKMHGHEDKNGLSWATRRHPSELRAPSGRAICRMPGPSICPSQGGGGTACTACRIILAPLDMPEQSSQHTNDAGGELGKREKTSWMGIWQPPLIASQLTIDAFGGVATGRRMEKKKAQVRWSAVSFCTRLGRQRRKMRIRPTCLDVSCLGDVLARARGFSLLIPSHANDSVKCFSPISASSFQTQSQINTSYQFQYVERTIKLSGPYQWFRA